jgi:phytoene dehydrogenase-like protein
MPESYNAIIIGGGHNGLVTAAYLAKAGRSVLVLERRETLGGAAATEEVFPGFKVNTGASDAGLFRREIVRDLNLHRHGLDFIESPVAAFAPQLDGQPLTLWRDPQKTRADIARFSEADAEQFPAFLHLLGRLTGVLDVLMTLTPPNLAERNLRQLLPWAEVGLKLKGLGKRDMMEFLRVLPMTVTEFLDEWFESEALKGVLGSAGIIGSMQGPQAAGTTLLMLYHYLGEAQGGFRASAFVRGGIGRLAAALVSAAQGYGAEIRTGAEVSQVLLADGRAKGVVLAGGQEIRADTVISNADPRRTFFDLVGPLNLEPTFVRRVRNIRYRGCTAKLNLALSGLPQMAGLSDNDAHLGGHIVISPNLEYLERAYDQAKYGRFSPRPYLDLVIPTLLDPSLAPAGSHLMSVTMQYAPYHLKGELWETQREALGETIITTLAEYMPDLAKLILHQQILTPCDWEAVYDLTEGGIYHGQMGLDQLLFMRPLPGYGQYRTPIENLYLCGAGTHPGGGVTGAPGYNAAREILRDRQ